MNDLKPVRYALLIVLVSCLVFTSYHIKKSEIDDANAAVAPASPVMNTDVTSSKASDFTLKSLDRHEVSLKGFAGNKYVLLAFWSTDSPYSDATLPFIYDLAQRYAKNDLEVLSIDKEEATEVVAQYAAKRKYMPTILVDEDGTVSMSYSVDAIPTFVLVSKSGDILFVEKGFDTITNHSLETKLCNALGVAPPERGFGRNRGFRMRLGGR
jgi:thiol-disulfide isomerase/thioredoxin